MSQKLFDLRYQRDIQKWSKAFSVAGCRLSILGRFLLCLVLIVGVVFSGFSQQRKELEDRRKKLIKDIQVTSKMLKETKESREAALERFVTLQRQIQKRQLLVKTLQEEIEHTNVSLDRASDVVTSLKDDIERLKKEYAEMVRHAYRQKLNNSALTFIFSAKNFNDAFQRWQYLRQYDDYRQKQARLILETQQTLTDKIESLEVKKEEKERLLVYEEQQASLLSYELDAKDKLLANLQQDELRLADELTIKQKSHEKLNSTIERIIRTEMEKKRRESRKKSRTTAIPRSVEDLSLSNVFEKNKGKLPWPVKKGVVTGYFGRQAHPTIKTIQIVNNGIDLRTDSGAEVRSVFQGRVLSATDPKDIPGNEFMVIIQHGNYYTVYSNLKKVLVKNGQKVETRQAIGIVSTNRITNASELHFEIWKEKNRLNPIKWVAKK